MAEQQNGEPIEVLTTDRCIDFAAGLLDEEERSEVLRLASASPDSEEMLRSVMAQAEMARSAAAVRKSAQDATAAEPLPARGSGLAERLGNVVASLFGPGRLVPAMAGVSLLILGLILGAGTVRLLQTDGMETGTPARLISLFPSATRTSGLAAAVSAGTGLYIELNGIEYPCETRLLFDLTCPNGQTVLKGRLHCQPETGEWAGLFLPDRLLTTAGTYRLSLNPVPGEGSSVDHQLLFSFDLD